MPYLGNHIRIFPPGHYSFPLVLSASSCNHNASAGRGQPMASDCHSFLSKSSSLLRFPSEHTARKNTWGIPHALARAPQRAGVGSFQNALRAPKEGELLRQCRQCRRWSEKTKTATSGRKTLEIITNALHEAQFSPNESPTGGVSLSAHSSSCSPSSGSSPTRSASSAFSSSSGSCSPSSSGTSGMVSVVFVSAPFVSVPFLSTLGAFGGFFACQNRARPSVGSPKAKQRPFLEHQDRPTPCPPHSEPQFPSILLHRERQRPRNVALKDHETESTCTSTLRTSVGQRREEGRCTLGVAGGKTGASGGDSVQHMDNGVLTRCCPPRACQRPSQPPPALPTARRW